MPAFPAGAIADLLRQRDADLPFIFVSDTSGEEAAVAAMRIGARDYILKNQAGAAGARGRARAAARPARGASGGASSGGSRTSPITTR